MNIKIAKNAGFCFGVERAVNGVLAWAKANKNKELKLYGMLIHNSYVIDRLTELNVKIIEDIDQINKDDIVFIRSHGVTFKEFTEIEKRANKVYDFTCPFVKKIHDIVYQNSNNGYNVIIVGDSEHPEVKGIRGYVNKERNCFVVNDIDELAEVIRKLDNKAIAVCQTTFDNKKWDELKLYLSQNSDVIIFDTICDATKKRQEDAKNLAKEVDVMLVIGDKKSSNTNKLFNVLKDLKPTYFIETTDDINNIVFENIDKVGITAGASTSQEQIDEIIKYLDNKFNRIDDEDFEKLINGRLSPVRKGEIIKGKVIKVEADYLLVDIGYKSEGIIYKSEIFKNTNVNLKNIFKKNDLIESMVIKESDEEGNVVLSKIKADLQNGFDELIKRFENKESITILVKQIKEKSIVGEYRGINIYVPISQWGEAIDENILGKMFEVEISDINHDRKIAFATRKNIIKQKMAEKFDEDIKGLDPNLSYEGKIVEIKDKGLIIEFNGFKGFVPIKEISYSRRKEDIFNHYKIGEKVNVQILDISKEKKQIYLSIRKTQEDEWIKNIEKLYLGMIVDAEVIKVLNFGIIVMLNNDLEGFAHISNIPIGYNQKLYNLFKPGDKIKAKVIEIDEQKRRISLSLKDLYEEDETPNNYNEEFLITIEDVVNNKLKRKK